MDKTAIVILNWNGCSMLQTYLPSVLEYSRGDAEIYVADNASTDNSLAMLEEHFPEVHVIRLERNYGFAEGYNKALAEVDAEYYILLNSDVEVTHHWLDPLVEFMDSHPETAACQPKLLSVKDRDFLNMQVPVAVIWTVTAILSAAVAFSARWKKTTDSMTIIRRYCGQREHAL